MAKDVSPAETTTAVAPPANTRLEDDSLALLNTLQTTQEELQTLYRQMAEPEVSEDTAAQVEWTAGSLKKATVNLRTAFYRARTLSDELSARWDDRQRSLKRRLLPAAPTNAAIDLAEERQAHFAQGLNVYKLLWLCYIGSFAGVVIELLWCLLTRGYLESRAGLVYGPFNLLYGVGAVALSLALYRYRNHSKSWSFIGGFLVGSLVEYVCSWGQEMLFGSRSWDYSAMPFNLNGRICLLYSVFWGLLGVLWIKSLYPRTAQVILRIPNRVGKVITWLLLAFFVFNAVMSLLAVLRWSQRVAGVEATNAFWQWIDLRFPDARMEHIYANMTFGS